MGGDASGIDAGLIGLFLLIGLFAVCGLLGWSMIRHIRKVPAAFDDGRAPRETPEDAGPTDERPGR